MTVGIEAQSPTRDPHVQPIESGARAPRRSGMSARAAPKSARSRSAPPEPGEVRVRALYGAISRGTERLVFAGRVPASEFERMRAPFMGGAFPFPVKYGYATVGRVEAGPADCGAASSLRSIRIRASSTCRVEAVVAGSRRRAAGPRGARRQHGDRAQRGVGRRAGSGRPHRRLSARGVVGALVAWLCGRTARAPM